MFYEVSLFKNGLTFLGAALRDRAGSRWQFNQSLCLAVVRRKEVDFLQMKEIGFFCVPLQLTSRSKQTLIVLRGQNDIRICSFPIHIVIAMFDSGRDKDRCRTMHNLLFFA